MTMQDFEELRDLLGPEAYRRIDPDGSMAEAVAFQNSVAFSHDPWTNPWHCKGKLSAAHKSIHYDGTIDAVAHSFCPNGFRPDIIGANVKIYKAHCAWNLCVWWPFGSPDEQTEENESSVKAIADGPCENGTYKTNSGHWMLVDVIYYSISRQVIRDVTTC